jgi:septal ring factor EnvC (AmiA/AmiB activator)
VRLQALQWQVTMGFLLGAVLLLCSGLANAQDATPQREAEQRNAQAQLDALRKDIASLAQQQEALVGERDGAARELRDADRRISEASSALRTLDADLAAQVTQLALLEGDEAALASRLEAQRGSLAQLLRALHAQGRHAPLKLLLAQDRVEALGRTLGYLGYFRRARVARIEGLLADLAALSEARAAVRTQQTALASARVAQESALAQLDTERIARRALLDDIEKRFRSSRSRLEALGRDEAALLALITRLRDIFGDIPRQLEAAEPFASLAGRLPWPLAGKLRTGFGRDLGDGRHSSGWLIDAQAGADVRAVAHGRVAFSDWLKGFGLIAIIDHGDGYMSLYASTDALLRAAGDWVEAGEVIALAGSSGGQAAPGVYFELRRNGKPVDPARWLLRQ